MEGVLTHPIVSHRGPPLHSLNKYIVNFLKAYAKDEIKNSKNSNTFSNYIRNAPINNDEIRVSFDVSSLYTTIHMINTLNTIKDYAYNDVQFTRKMAILQDKFLDLVKVVLRTNWYALNPHFNQKTDGVAIRGPASSTTAKTYMQAHGQTALSRALHPPKLWGGFVYVVYSILKRTLLKNFFHRINNLLQNIKFTMDEGSNGELTFLDTLLVYRKPTHTDQYLHYISQYQTS